MIQRTGLIGCFAPPIVFHVISAPPTKNMATTTAPDIGEGGVVSEGRPLPLHSIPVEVGLRRQLVEYSCLDASQQFLVVGSLQGFVWVMELHSFRLLREFNDCKGSAIAVVKLNPVRDYLAYGTDNGMVCVERISKVLTSKLRVQEKNKQDVNCLEWNHSGEDIFCGFDSGRLVQFNVKFTESSINRVPLHPEEYGSPIVQLSALESKLLVMTLDRAFVLDTVSHRLNQVGRKERKPGRYGGCFLSDSQTLFSRPGLRIWTADIFGTVLNTLTFKETLATQPIPAIVLNSISIIPLQFSRTWQFSTLHSMLGGKFVATFHNNAIFVLDPVLGRVVGACALEHSVTSISVSGGFLYILSKSPRPIVRVAIHHSFVSKEASIRKISKFATFSSSCSNSPAGSQESLSIHLEVEKSQFTSNKDTSEHAVPMLQIQPNSDIPSCDIAHLPDNEGMKLIDSVDQEASFQNDESNSCVDNVPAFSQDTGNSQTANDNDHSDEDTSGIKVFINGKEHSRRVRMSQAVGEEVIADSASQRRKRKKNKGKKISSAPSSASVSMEKLADIAEKVEVQDEARKLTGDEADYDVRTLVGGEVGALAGDEAGTLAGDEVGTLAGDEAGTLAGDEAGTLAGDHAGTLAGEEEGTLAGDEARTPGDEAGTPAGDKAGTSADDEAGTFASNKIGTLAGGDGGTLLDLRTFAGNEGGVAASDYASTPGDGARTLAGNSFPSAVDLHASEDVSMLEENVLEESHVIFQERNVNDSAGSIKDEVVEQLKMIDNESGQHYTLKSEPIQLEHSLGTSYDSSVAALPGGSSDDPLYRDSGEEQESRDACATVTAQGMKDSHREEPILHHSLLQPALSNPLEHDNSDHEHEEMESFSEIPTSIVRPKHIPGSLAAHSSVEVKVQDEELEVSDSSHESDTGGAIMESQVADDFYQLCGELVRHTAVDQDSSPISKNHFSQNSISDSNSLGQAAQSCEVLDVEADKRPSEEQNWDMWVPVPFPSRNSLHCVCLSDTLLWAVDSRGRVFCTANHGRDWQRIKKAMHQVASSASGSIVWSTYHQNAYVRLGIGMNPAGSTWKNVTKNTSLAHKVKQVAVDEAGVWAITTDSRVLFRKGVDERNPEGRVWQEVGYGMDSAAITCCKNIVWMISNSGKVFIRDGITPSSPSGRKWSEIKSPKMISVSVTSDGIVWGINDEGSIGFRSGVDASKPCGRGPWWEVVVNVDSQASSPLSLLWSVDGNSVLSSAVSSLVSLPQQHHAALVSASSKSGVVVLEGGHKLHGCWRTATGYHYTSACKDGVFQFNVWSHVAAGGSGLWFVRNDGDLYCLCPGNDLKRVEVPSTVELIAASQNCMWVISKDMVWSRQGMTTEFPEGISFDYIELSTLLHDKKLRSVACGKKVVWGIDSSGVPHFRFGVHAREPGTGMSPAWVPVEDQLIPPLLQIAVCQDDWLVWACDEEYSVYARSGVTNDFPVGRKWVNIPREKIKELAATSDRMYGLTPSGELMCRHGISKTNVQGSFWRKMPGKYEHIATGPCGDLWALDSKGQVWKQEQKVIQVSDTTKDFDVNTSVDPEAWEFI